MPNNFNDNSNNQITENLQTYDIINVLCKVTAMCLNAYTCNNYQQIKDSIIIDDINKLKDINQWLCFIILVLNSNLSKKDKNYLIIDNFVDSNIKENLSETNGTLNEDFPDIFVILDLIDKYADNSLKNELKGKLNKYKDKLKDK